MSRTTFRLRATSVTRRIEAVETANIGTAIKRLRVVCGDDAYRRALYHAICMDAFPSWEERKAIREALKLA